MKTLSKERLIILLKFLNKSLYKFDRKLDEGKSTVYDFKIGNGIIVHIYVNWYDGKNFSTYYHKNLENNKEMFISIDFAHERIVFDVSTDMTTYFAPKSLLKRFDKLYANLVMNIPIE